MVDSVLPPNDREWLAKLIKDQGDRSEKRIALAEERLGERIGKLEERQADHERALRNSSVTDLEHERRIEEQEKRMAALGAAAGKESGEAIAKKYGAILTLVMTAIVAVAQIVQSLVHGTPIPPPPRVPQGQETASPER